MPVIAVPLEDPWFDQNVGDILYHVLKRGKPAVDKWLKGMGSVDEVEPTVEQGLQQPAAASHIHMNSIITTHPAASSRRQQ
jgi:hypothetical protein